METTKPKPHPHADLIKAWADGAEIQYFDEKRNVWDDCLLNAPTWGKDIKYRIKPEESDPWKPKLKDKYFILDLFAGEIRVKYYIWYDTTVDNALYRNHNCFRTEEEAEAAIPRVIDSLKGNDSLDSKKSFQLQLDVKDAEIKKLTDELETLKIRCNDLQITKDPLIASRAEMDALTDGEIALIKALRLYDLSNITCNNKSALVVAEDASGKPTTNTIKQFVAFYPDFADNKKVHEDVISALEKIKKEQEAE